MKRYFILIIVLINLLASCKEVADFYLGVPLQPKFEKDSYVPGLNIFGILRPDSTGRYNNSFIEIQKVMPAVGLSDSLNVDTVDVQLTNLSLNTNNNNCNFLLTDFNSVFTKSNYRPDCVFNPKPGDIYSIECYYSELPTLLAHTIIPNSPELLENSILKDENTLYFEIKPDTSIFMFDIYFYNGSQLIDALRLPASASLNTKVILTTTATDIDSVKIFGYDYNMASYYLTSNTSLNFNKYRNSYSTVENGYGVFGSLNFSSFKIP